MAKSKGMQVLPPALPTTAADFLTHRKSKAGLSNIDRAEALLLAIVNGGNDMFQKYIEAVYDQQSVEGSIKIDHTVASQIMRQHAIETGDTIFGALNLKEVGHNLNAALKRFSLDRTTRRKSVGSISPPTE